MRSAPDGIEELIRGVVSGASGDAEVERWLREVYERGLSAEDTFALTMAMARSGETIDWSGVPGPIVDKHSTGGVGDAVTLIAVPVAAACGVRVAKLSGRALGHTGGTIDKLECIPGLRTDLEIAEFRSIVAHSGCAIASATATLAPADKRLYALRHTTGLIGSIPLIAASVMSKKLAAGADAIVLDVKYGRGAFIERPNDARALADAMRTIGARAGRRVATLLTNMDQPLADSVGDALELDEALRVLQRRGGSPALRDTATTVAAAMIELAGKTDARRLATQAIENGSAFDALKRMAAAQGGDLDAFERTWPKAEPIAAAVSGRIAHLDARLIGEVVADAKRSADTSAGRRMGVRVLRRPGTSVAAGQPVLAAWLPAPDPRLARAIDVDAEAAPR